MAMFHINFTLACRYRGDERATALETDKYGNIWKEF
jgi:hypothetical protein